jgi:hypothetical protein
MNTLGVSSESALCTSSRVLLRANRQHVATVAAPVGGEVREGLEAMGNPVVDLLLVRIRLSVALTDTLRDDAAITLGVASVLAVLALHACRVLEEVPAEGATHDIVELALDELVTEHFVHFLLSLTHGALAVETSVHHARSPIFLDEVKTQLDLPRRLQVEPSIDRL